jgi:CRP-like cAMP-binding protein
LVAETYSPGDVIIKEGEEGDKFYLVIEGFLTAYKYSHA